MKNSEASTPKVDAPANGEHNGAARSNGQARPHNTNHSAEYNQLIERAKTWVENNQTASMLSGFGFGVFIGVLLRR